jgi:hypothetical protein
MKRRFEDSALRSSFCRRRSSQPLCRNREVRLGTLFLAEIRQAKMVRFVGESIEVIRDRASLGRFAIMTVDF